jgi:uncharacterized protein YgbK (DUF1537 family)
MQAKILDASVLTSFPTPDQAHIDALLATEIAHSQIKFVVLDDDPTGVQTVHDVSVYTSWDDAAMLEAFREPSRLFYILTNSRSMTQDETTLVHQQIMASVASAARQTNKRYLFISRSDSTLRGHYPLETELLRKGMENEGIDVDGEVLFPFFKEGGRYTIANVHYVRNGQHLIPAAQTEFAHDATFGYTHSALPDYIEEKTEGRYKAQDVICISLDDLRAVNIDKICSQLKAVTNFNKVCVNAADYCDVKVFCIALYRAMASGKTFLFRTAASFVKVVGGISDKALLTRKDMIRQQTTTGGLVVVGSHTDKTTEQLRELLKLPNTQPVAFRSSAVLEGEAAFVHEIERCVNLEEDIMSSNKTAVCYTERSPLSLPGDSKEDALRRSVKIGDGVWRLVGQLKVAPAFIIAKGGITSSDVGTKALGVRRARVMGQIAPGIPVWQTGAESRFPTMAYVIFPGNVGEATTLRDVVSILQG